jgi:hypothetical protein
MAQPTDFQLNFVSDIEAGTRALIAQGAQVTKMSQVTDAAGRDLVEVSQFVGRFVDLGHWELIERLAKAFLSVNLTPLSIARALEAMAKHAAKDEAPEIDPEPLELEMHIPVEVIESKALEVKYGPEAMGPKYYPTTPEPEELLYDVIKMISRLPQLMLRRKVAGMAANWFGVGG